MRYILFTAFGFFLILCSCKNDLVINAPWKDITLVYGLLNQKDSVHYIKINKAYLGDGDAMIMAMNPDSSSYANNLDVRVEEWKNGQYNNKTLVFDTTSIYNKDSGTFYGPKQIIYKSNVKLDSSNGDVEYKLRITNKSTGKIISAKTRLIKSFHIIKPQLFPMNPTVDFSSRNPVEVEFSTAPDGNAMYFKIYFRFHYFEQDTITMASSINFLDFYVGEATYDYTALSMALSFPGKDFYSMLKSKIPRKPNTIRKVKFGEEIELIIYAADFNFYTYLQFVNVSSGVVQDPMEFTNIENGYGIFASRFYLKTGYHLSSKSLDSLYFGSYTRDLGFIR